MAGRKFLSTDPGGRLPDANRIAGAVLPDDDIARRRALGVAGAAALMGVWLVCVVLVVGVLAGDGDPEPAALAPSPSRTPAPTPTATPEPTPEPLTAEQRAMRGEAADLVRSKGFEPVKLRHYDPRRTLRVLIGRTTAGTELPFFFVGETYIGNGTSSPSRDLRIVRRQDTQVTLAFGDTRVRFKWDGVRLAPLDPLPAARQ